MSTNAPVVKEYDIPMTEPYHEPKRLPAIAPDRIIGVPVRQPLPERVSIGRVCSNGIIQKKTKN